MLISIEAATSSVEWEFRDSRAFSAWMNARPWRSGGGVRLLRLPDLAVLPACCQSIQRLAYSVELGDHRLKFFMPEQGVEPSGSLSAALTQALCGEPRALARFELRKRIIEELNRWPVFFIILSDPSCALGVISEAKNLREELQKERVQPVYPLTILFVEGAESSGGDTEFFDFSVGFPWRRLFENTEFETDLWQTYVHLRTAWESAGNPATAAKILSGISCTTGDDNAVESGLNRYAEDRLKAVPGRDLDELSRFLRHMGGASLSQRERLQCRSFLASRQLLWSPPGQSESQIVPWGARALVLGTYESNVAMLLRYAIVALPLANEALGKCFELEARERSLYWPMRRGCVPTAEVERDFARFTQGSSQSISPLYPEAAPRVLDPWCFASMGDFFAGLPRDSGTDHRFNVRLVRNALSHGHGLSWNMLKMLRSAENALLSANRSLPYELRTTLQKT